MKLLIGNELNESVELCRYFSFESFVSLLETQTLTFTKISNWEDPWENELSNYSLDNNGKIEKPLYSADKYFFGQCWTLKLESDAMWRIYSPNLSGVKVTTKVKKLKSLGNTRLVGVEKVVYFSHWKELPELTSNDTSRYKTVKYKRNAFSHEEEVRFIIHPQDITESHDYHSSSHISLPLDIADFIESIEIDPRAPAWIENMVKTYSKRALPNVMVGKSSLYQPNSEFQIVVKYLPIEK
ncbi:DUF2971 domain-containing protein [Shewanella baltica]|uniref:DUF2971 domain-containing protein n=1 Tax=Shewanella baltica TaxID=62322 RepID=UPI003CFBD5F1